MGHLGSVLQPPLAAPAGCCLCLGFQSPLQASTGELLVSLCSTKVAGLSHVEQAWTVGRVGLWMCSVERLLRFPEGRGVQHLLNHVLAGARLCSCFMGLGCLQLGGWKLFTQTSTNVISLLRHGPTVSTRPIRWPCLSGQKKPASTWCRSMGRGDTVAPPQVCEKSISVPWCPGSVARRVLAWRRGGSHPHAPCRCVPAGWVGNPPPAGTEVFIGKLPQDMYENVLIPLFQSVGKLYEFRLMMTFSGLNRGFAYAKYSNRRSAKEAIAAFNNFEVREGCAIVVCKSTEKCELSVDGLATSVSQRELEAVLRRVTEGFLSVTLYASPCQKQAQLAVLKYSSHQAAAMAKKTLMEGKWEARVLRDAAGCCLGWSSWHL